MAKKYYSTQVVEVGKDAANFINAGRMIVLFDDSMALPEVRNFSVLHSGNKLDDTIKPGDTIKIADSEFKILKVGSDVQKNLINLGHMIIKFDGGMEEYFESSIHVEDKPIPKIQFGDEISIEEASNDLLSGKNAFINNGDSALGKSVAQALTENGAKVIADKDQADIIVEVK